MPGSKSFYNRIIDKMGRPLITSVLTEGELTRLRAKSFGERNRIIQDALARKMRIKVEARRERERRELLRRNLGLPRNIDPKFIF